MSIDYFDPVMNVNRRIGPPSATRKPLLVPLGMARELSRRNNVQPPAPRRSAPLTPTVEGGCTEPGCTSPRVPSTGKRGRPPTRCEAHVRRRTAAARPVLAPRGW